MNDKCDPDVNLKISLSLSLSLSLNNENTVYHPSLTLSPSLITKSSKASQGQELG